MNSKNVRLLSAGLLLFAIITTGCTSKRILSGKVVKAGAPLTVSDKGVLQVAFYAESDTKGEKPIATDTKNDGTFRLVGTDGKGIATGKYRVSVVAYDPYGGPKPVDVLGGKFAPDKSTLIVDISGGEVVVDVGK